MTTAATNPINYVYHPLTQWELQLFDELPEMPRRLWRDRAKNLNRRADKAGEPNRVNGRELYALAQRYDDKCAYCDKLLHWGGGGTALLQAMDPMDARVHPQRDNDPAAGTFDHNHSLQQGGSGGPENIVPACWNCNRDMTKWDRQLNPELYQRPHGMPDNPLERDTSVGDEESWIHHSTAWQTGEIQLQNPNVPHTPGTVRCPNCAEETELEVCPHCGKPLGVEWQKKEDTQLPFDHPPQSPDAGFNEFWTDVKAVPKANPDKTDNSWPSMLSRLAGPDKPMLPWSADLGRAVNMIGQQMSREDALATGKAQQWYEQHQQTIDEIMGNPLRAKSYDLDELAADRQADFEEYRNRIWPGHPHADNPDDPTTWRNPWEHWEPPEEASDLDDPAGPEPGAATLEKLKGTGSGSLIDRAQSLTEALRHMPWANVPVNVQRAIYDAWKILRQGDEVGFQIRLEQAGLNPRDIELLKQEIVTWDHESEPETGDHQSKLAADEEIWGRRFDYDNPDDLEGTPARFDPALTDAYDRRNPVYHNYYGDYHWGTADQVFDGDDIRLVEPPRADLDQSLHVEKVDQMGDQIALTIYPRRIMVDNALGQSGLMPGHGDTQQPEPMLFNPKDPILIRG